MTASPTTPTLDALEWSAVAIALQDAGRCGCGTAAPPRSRGRVSRLASTIFGERRPNGLADPRLEAVRRFVCATSRKRRPATELAAPLVEQGYSAAQIDALALLSI